jgi:hypothetical protein
VQGPRAVQVVLGEGEPGILRLVLEAQGFDVVGHARDEAELRQIVGLTHPNVIVLDAGISALALLDTQVRSDYVPIVVVWPNDAYTPAAEERVDPSTAFLELGNAVRRVVERHAEPIRIPEAEEDPIAATPLPPRSIPRRRTTARMRHALTLAAAWTIAFIALAAIGLAVPSAFRALQPVDPRHPKLDRPERALTLDRERPVEATVGVDGRPSCERGNPSPPDRGKGLEQGKGGTHGRGCALGHEEHGTPANRGSSKGHGRPDDPGKGSGSSGEHGAPVKEKKEKSGDHGSDRGSEDGGGAHAEVQDPPAQGEQGGGRAGRSYDEGASTGSGNGSGRN